MTKLMVLNREVRRKLEAKGRLFEYQVLAAIHNVQVSMAGSTRSPKYSMNHWKFASRPQIMKAMGLSPSRSLERRIKKAVAYLSKIGHLAYWVGTNAERRGKKLATRFWICFDAIKYLFTVALNIPLFAVVESKTSRYSNRRGFRSDLDLKITTGTSRPPSRAGLTFSNTMTSI